MKFLFIVPTLDSGKDLYKFSDSLINQTLKSWRVLFIDGGSKDRDLKIFSELEKNDNRFKLCKQKDPRTGIFGAMNEGFNLADSDEYIFFWGSDDLAMNKDVLERIQKRVLINEKKSQQKHLYIFKGRYFNKVNNKLGRVTFFPSKNIMILNLVDTFSSYMFFGFTPPHQSTLFSPLVRNYFKGYSLKYKLSADLDCFIYLTRKIRVSFESFDINIIKIADSGISAKSFNSRLLEVFLIYKKYYGALFFFPLAFRYIFKIALKVLSLIINKGDKFKTL